MKDLVIWMYKFVEIIEIATGTECAEMQEHAHFALPFTQKEQFSTVFARLKAALKPGGIFVGQFFGVNDTWNMPETTMTFLTHEQAQTQLTGLEIVEFEEEDQDGTTARGDARHWHVYHIIARRP